MSGVTFRAPAFICPLCQINSQQTWFTALEPKSMPAQPYADLCWATCLHCWGRTIWYKERLVAPIATSAPLPNPDMPSDIKADFEEARDIAELSPRSAAALLRLCVQKLCLTLGGSGVNLNEDIAWLVSQGLPSEIKEACDAVRIVGNSQLHPRSDGIDLRSNPEATSLLFTLVNLIVENQISLPRKTKEFFASLPESARESVKRRDENQKKTPTVISDQAVQ